MAFADDVNRFAESDEPTKAVPVDYGGVPDARPLIVTSLSYASGSYGT